MASAGFASLFQTRFQLLHVVVGIAETLRFTQTYAVDDRGMVQGIGNNRIFRAQQSFEQTAVGIETGGIQDRIFHTEELSEFLFKLLVAVLRTADKTYRGHAEAVAVHPRFRGGNQFRMVGQTQVVIGAEVNDMASIRHGDISLLGRRDNAFFFKQPFRTCGLQVAR
jgi:hypothetical protein